MRMAPTFTGWSIQRRTISIMRVIGLDEQRFIRRAAEIYRRAAANSPKVAGCVTWDPVWLTDWVEASRKSGVDEELRAVLVIESRSVTQTSGIGPGRVNALGSSNRWDSCDLCDLWVSPIKSPISPIYSQCPRRIVSRQHPIGPILNVSLAALLPAQDVEHHE